MSDPKITVLLGGGTKNPTAELLRRAEAEWPIYAQAVAFEAKRKKLAYDEYIKVGFTSEQAITLIK